MWSVVCVPFVTVSFCDSTFLQGHRRIFAPNDFTGSGFGWRNSTACGTCYAVTGIAASSIVVVSTHCPDCATLTAHFDMSSEAALIIDGGTGPGTGTTGLFSLCSSFISIILFFFFFSSSSCQLERSVLWLHVKCACGN